jgi:hypothetical protein
MVFDPKTIYEERQPEEKPKSVPRPRFFGGLRTIALYSGTCRQCGQPYRSGDDVVEDLGATKSIMASGSLEHAPRWHPKCWDDVYVEGHTNRWPDFLF